MSNVDNNFLLPLELDHLILSFVSHTDEFTDPVMRLKTMLAYSLTCRRFRALALPYLFAKFSGNSKSGLREFFQAWMSGDKAAIHCAQYITDCFLNYTRFQHPYHDDGSGTPSHIIVANNYLSSFSSLPKLANLRMTLGRPDMNLENFQQLLKTVPLKSLWIVNIKPGQRENPFETDYVEELSRILSDHATALKELTVMVPDFMLDFSILSRAKFQLECLALRLSTELVTGPQTLGQFLSATPSLTTLRFEQQVGGPEILSGLSDTDLPHIHTLSCPISYVPLFLNGLRPICTLELEIQRIILSDPDVAVLTGALRRSAGTIRQLRGLPLAFALSPWSELTPHLEYISLNIAVKSQAMFDPFALPKMHEDVLNAIENVGKGSNLEDPTSSHWPNLSRFDLTLQRSYSYDVDQDMEIYCLNLSLQRNDLRVLTKRFPTLAVVGLGLHTLWTRPLDALEEWKVKVVGFELPLLEEIVQRMKGAARSVPNTVWPKWDHDGVLAEILKSRSD